MWTLCLLVPPVISPHPKEYTIAVDKPVTLPCEADGLPPPAITWHKDGHAVVESVRQRILSSGALQIAFAQPGDAGQYTCTAANVAGSRSASTKLTVHGRCFHGNYFSLLHYHGKEKRLLRRHLVKIKTTHAHADGVGTLALQVCFLWAFFICVRVCVSEKEDLINIARIIIVLPIIPSYYHYWDLYFGLWKVHLCLWLSALFLKLKVILAQN